MEGLKPGRIVYFVFDEQSAGDVNRRYQHAREHRKEHEDRANGVQLHIGNPVAAGDICPAMVLRVWGDSGCSNLKVMLDGTDDFWATSVNYDEAKGPRTWHWMFEGQAGRYDATKTH